MQLSINGTIPQEVVQHFQTKLKTHQRLVSLYISHLSKFFPQYRNELAKEYHTHDDSKFKSEEEKRPYMILTAIQDLGEKYSMADDATHEAIINVQKIHASKNAHHPEFWEDKTQMPEWAMILMVANLAAKAKETKTSIFPLIKANEKGFTEDQKNFVNQLATHCK